MARPPSLRSLLLVLALLAGQWLAFTHGLQHSALNPDGDCQICLQVRHLGSGTPSAPPAGLHLAAVQEAPVSAPAAGILQARCTAYRARAPPIVLV